MNIRGIGNNGEWLCCSPIILRKKESKINTLKFEDYEELCCYAADRFDDVKDNDDLCSVTIVAKYEEAKRVIENLICIGYPIASIDGLNDSDYDGYCDEFVVTLSPTDEGTLWCEPFKRHDEYFTNECAIALVMDNCSARVLEHLECDESYEVSVGEDEDSCDVDCENCDCKDLDTDSSEYTHISREKDGKIAGFTKSWSDTENGISYYSSYSHYSTDEDALRKVAEDFGIRL